MAIPVSWPPIGGTPYSVPQTGETNWGALTNYLVALSGAQSTTSQKVAARVVTTTPVIITATTDCAIVVNLTVPGPSTVQLPLGTNGQYFVIADGKGDAGVNNITVLPGLGATINNALSFVINSNQDSITVLYNASTGNWKVTSQIQSFSPGSVARATIQAGTPNYVVINAPVTGFLAEEQYLNQIRGGFGQNVAGFNGVVKAVTGAFSASPIVNADIDPLAGISASKIGTGTVDDTEFARLNEIGILYNTTRVSGGTVTINGGDPAKFDVSAGKAKITSYAGSPDNPSIQDLTFGPFSAVTVTNLATADVTYVFVNSSGSLLQQTTFPTPTERRTNVYLARVNHINHVAISFIDMIGDVAQSLGNQYGDLVDAIGPFNIQGNVVSANGANLNYNKSNGQMFSRYFNSSTTPLNPHFADTGPTVPSTFQYRLQSSLYAPGNTIAIDPVNYDNGTAAPVAVGGGAGNSTVQRVFLFPSNQMRVQYGQTIYPTLADAVAAIPTQPFVTNSATSRFGILIAYIAVNRLCTALNDPLTCRIILAGRFETGSGGASGGTSTLQTAYNNSIAPILVLSAAPGIFRIRDNAVPLGTSLFAVSDNTAATQYIDVSTQGIKSNQYPTAGRVLITDGNSAASQSSVTSTELGYISGSTGVTGTGNIVRSISPVINTPDIDGGTASNTSRITIPKNTYANLLTLTRKEGTILYATDLDFFLADDGITLTPIGSGGAGVKNYIPTPNSATNWVASGAGISVTTETSSANFPDNITQRQAIKVLRASGADYVYTRWTMDQADYGKLCGILFDLKYGGTAGDYTLSLFTNTASNYLGTYTQVTLPTSSIPSTGSLSSSFQTSGLAGGSGTQFMELRINGIAGTTPLYLNNVTFTPNAPAQGAAISEWQSYTPTFQNLGTSPGTPQFFYRRVGSSLEIQGKVVSGNPNSGSSPVSFTLPSGYTVNGALQTTTGLQETVYGTYTLATSGGPSNVYAVSDAGVLIANGASTNKLQLAKQSVGAQYAFGAGTTIFPATGTLLNVWASVPIAEFAGNGTVNLGPGAQVEYAYNSSTSTTSDTTSFASGPQGANIVVYSASGTTSVVKRIRFQYPIQADDIIVLENDGGTSAVRWFSFAERLGGYSANDAGSTAYGYVLVPVNATDVDVNFYSAASPGVSWSSFTTFRWRVRKAKASAPVGFGLALSNQSGLVSGEEFGTFTASLTGCTTVPTVTAQFARVGRLVSIHVPTLTGTSNTTAATITGMPSTIFPVTQQRMPSETTNAGTVGNGLWEIGTGGVITLFATVAGGAFTNSGTKGTSQSVTITYIIGI